MRKTSVKTISMLIRRSVLQAIAVAVVAAFLLSFIYGFVHHYQQKRLHLQQLAGLLASSASTPDGAMVVARQVRFLLEDDPTIQSIVFYSTDNPLVSSNQETVGQTTNDWYNALFADTVSFNRAVTSRSIQASSSRESLSAPAINANHDSLSENTTLVGYINITLDVDKLRSNWLRSDIFFWLITIGLGAVGIWLILRKLKWPSKDIAELARVCEMVIDNPELKQLPPIQQRFEFQELNRIRQAFITLFARLKTAQQKVDALAAFEQQLHNKDMSLDVQRHNFQSMITHELKTSLNAISGGLQLLNADSFNEEQLDVLAIIRKGSQHLDTTLEQIIQLNKIEKGQIGVSLSSFNPLQLLADLFAEFEPMAKQKDLELTSRVHHVDYALEGDVNKIKQILATLIDNAIKFTKSGKVVVESQLNHFNDSIRWQIKVIDTGIGIDAKYMEDIFTPFFQVDPSHTREYEGAGVGLPVARQILQLIGATIEVNSELGLGSEFTIVMPLHNTYQVQQQHSLSELNIVYYHRDDTIGFIVEELQRLGVVISCHQHELAVLEQLVTNTIDMVMVAEDILPEKATQLARLIREQEVSHRTLLIYWYPLHEANYLDNFEPGLKAVGVDYCHSVTQDSKVLRGLMKQWLAWS